MVLAIEIDNSRISFGFFNDNGILVSNFGIASDVNKTSDEYAVLIDSVFNYYKIERNNVDGGVLCSVVPMLTGSISYLMKKMFPDINFIFVEKGIKTGFSIKVDNPSELGADLVANAVAVMQLKSKAKTYNKSSIIVDIGTASTVFALNSKNEFVGGSIMPGVDMSLTTLHGKTAQLPNVTLMPPTRIIGKNSQESIRSGVIVGTALMIDGFVEKFSKELSDEADVFITGEYAEPIIQFCSCHYQYVPNLTFLGLYYIYKNNIENR